MVTKRMGTPNTEYQWGLVNVVGKIVYERNHANITLRAALEMIRFPDQSKIT